MRKFRATGRAVSLAAGGVRLAAGGVRLAAGGARFAAGGVRFAAGGVALAVGGVRFAVGGVALAAVAVVPAGCGVSARTASTAATHLTLRTPTRLATGVPLGTTERVPAAGTTIVVTVKKVIDPLTGSGAKVPAGTVPVGVVISARNAGPGGYDSSATSDFTLLSGHRTAMPVYVPAGTCQTYVQDFMNEVGRGQERNGCIGYAVPRGDPPTTVRFAPDGGTAGRTRSWTLP